MMKELLVLLILVAVSYAVRGPCNNYKREKLNEGYSKCAYDDPLGIPSVGAGFNLNKPGARQAIEGVGANYDNVLSGRECLTDCQIETLYRNDMDEAVSCTKDWLGLIVWSILGQGPQSAVADMAYNMGCGKLQDFEKLKEALTESPPNYESARNEMRDSKWCEQVGNRCDRDIECMK